MYKTVYLKKGKEESLHRFHPWIFSGAIAQVDPQIKEGDTVRILTAAGNFIALGHYQIGSIAVRVLSFDDREIGSDFWRERISSALNMRLAIGIVGNSNETYRIIHGEGDMLPGLVADIYGTTCRLIQLGCMFVATKLHRL